jgi:hypothetical protein
MRAPRSCPSHAESGVRPPFCGTAHKQFTYAVHVSGAQRCTAVHMLSGAHKRCTVVHSRSQKRRPVRTAAPPSSPGPCAGAAAPKPRGTWSIRSASAAPSADADASSAAAARVPVAAAAAAWPVPPMSRSCGSSARSGRSGADGECVWLSAYAEAKGSSCTVGRCCSSSRLRSSISRLRSRTCSQPHVSHRQPHVSQRSPMCPNAAPCVP